MADDTSAGGATKYPAPASPLFARAEVATPRSPRASSKMPTKKTATKRRASGKPAMTKSMSRKGRR